MVGTQRVRIGVNEMGCCQETKLRHFQHPTSYLFMAEDVCELAGLNRRTLVFRVTCSSWKFVVYHSLLWTLWFASPLLWVVQLKKGVTWFLKPQVASCLADCHINAALILLGHHKEGHNVVNGKEVFCWMDGHFPCWMPLAMLHFHLLLTRVFLSPIRTLFLQSLLHRWAYDGRYVITDAIFSLGHENTGLCLDFQSEEYLPELASLY